MQFPVLFQLLAPAAVLAPNGLQNWQLVATGATMAELKTHARAQKLAAYAIFVLTPVETYPPEISPAAPPAGGGVLQFPANTNS